MMATSSAEPTDTAARGRPRSPAVDASVLEAVLVLIGEVGIGSMSVDEVAARAGVSKASIYRRWSSKEAMVLDALERSLDVFDAIDTGDTAADLRAYAHELARRFREGQRRDVLPHLIAAAHTDPGVAETFQRFVANRRRPVLAIVERGIERGGLRDDVDPGIAVDLIVGPLMYRRLVGDRSVDGGFADAVVDAALAYLASDRA